MAADIDDEIIALRDIVRKKGWSDLRNAKNDYVEDVLIELFRKMSNKEQRDLLASFIEEFFWVDVYNDAIRYLVSELDNIFSDVVPIVVPVSAKNGEIKSGHAFVYEFKALNFFLECKYSYGLDVGENNIEDNFVLMDDFCGTGRQVSSDVSYLLSIGCDPNRIWVCCIVMMNEARLRLEGLGVNVIAKQFVHDAFTSPKVIEFEPNQVRSKQIYHSMAIKTSAPKNFRRGFRNSSALVALKRTPNNTLAIFWWPHDNDESEWPAPFPTSRVQNA